VGQFFRRLLAPDSAQKAYKAKRKRNGQGWQGRRPQKQKRRSQKQKQAQRRRRAAARKQVVSRTVIGYGNGNFPVAARGQAAGPLKPLCTVLARQVKVCLMDEYRTSQVHAECEGLVEKKHLRGLRWRKKPREGRIAEKLRRGPPIMILGERERAGRAREQLVETVRDPWSLRWCPACRKFLARDANSAILMLHLLDERLRGHGRPECLSRRTCHPVTGDTTTTV